MYGICMWRHSSMVRTHVTRFAVICVYMIMYCMYVCMRTCLWLCVYVYILYYLNVSYAFKSFHFVLKLTSYMTLDPVLKLSHFCEAGYRHTVFVDLRQDPVKVPPRLGLARQRSTWITVAEVLRSVPLAGTDDDSKLGRLRREATVVVGLHWHVDLLQHFRWRDSLCY